MIVRPGLGTLALVVTLALALILLLSPTTIDPRDTAAYREVHEHVVAPVVASFPKWDWATSFGQGGATPVHADWDDLVEGERIPSEDEARAGEERVRLQQHAPAVAGDTAEEKEVVKEEPTTVETKLDQLDSGPQPMDTVGDVRPAAIVQEDEDDRQDDVPAAAIDTTLPQCKRTLFVHIRGSRGFASEFNRMVKLATIGHHYGYEIVLKQSKWMYGRYEK